MRSMDTRGVLAVGFTLATLALACTLSGCSVWDNRPRLREKEIDMEANVDQVPRIMIRSLNGKAMLVMQAPHSGWSIGFDRDERIADGVRIFVTVRRPNPAFMYPQAIVEMNLLTQVDSDALSDVYARILDSDEQADGHGYGLITPVDVFDE